MRYKRILFVIPPFITRRRAPFAGIGYLSAFLSYHSIENDVIDMTVGYSIKDLFKKIDRFNPDLIGIFMMTYRHKVTYELIKQINDKYNINVVVGGPHVSINRSKVLEESLADFAIKLEGEFTLKELCEGKELDKIDGLIHRDGGKVIENRDRAFIKDLDALPFPTYDKFELHKYTLPDGVPIISSRGCPYSCTFCPVTKAIGQIFRMRSAESVVKEIEYWHRRGYRKFAFQDDNFTLVKERVHEICDLIERRGLRGLILSLPNGVRADRVDRALLEKMKRVGFRGLAFGVEGGNDKVLRALKKGESIETIEKAIRDACELGFDVALFFLVGSPRETPTDVMDSVRLALKYPITHAFFYNLIPYPQTELYAWIEANHYFVKPPSTYLAEVSVDNNDPVFETPEFPLKERRAMLEYTKGVMKLIRIRSLEHRLPRFVFPRKIWARVLASEFGEKHILENKIFWKIYDSYIRCHCMRTH